MTAGRSLDRKIDRILDGRYEPDDFIIADAKDADMAWGVAAPGEHGRSTDVRSTGTFRTRSDYLDDMRALVAEGVIDILLTSASNGERLAVQGLVGDDVTLAVRANDTTDIWNPRGGNYPASPSRPFRTVRLEAIKPFCDLVLYSVTFNNDVALDTATLNSYRDFRAESADLGVRYFLEVFNPNAPQALNGSDIGCFVNDSIVRALAGVTSSERPLFLKMAYNGQVALRELVEHDPSIVVGILGGSAGTTRDTFELLQRAEAAGARVALFGRKIQRAESQLELVRLMRPVLRGDLTPAEAVQVYHKALAAARIEPIRSLKDDIDVTDPLLRGE